MIIVDTNVLSEVLRPMPYIRVETWMSDHSGASLCTTTITLAEIFYGLELIPQGKRKELHVAIETLFAAFDGRILPFDNDAAREFASIFAGRRKSGRPMRELDGQIAAIARSRGAAVATRNIRDFEDCGIELINPWAA